MTLYSFKAELVNFKGNPNHAISSIDVSGGIQCSRTSGKAPCFVTVSAGLITATGTDYPFKDLYYKWDFGDASSAETFTNPGVGGGTKNSNDDQDLPIATHVYRAAGTYTITLKVYGNRTGSLVYATTTQEIVVSAFSASGGEYWADSTHGGTNAGTEANPFNTVAAINTAISSGTNKTVHVKKGSAFDGTTSLTWGVTSGLRFDTYGTGATPSFNISSGTSANNALKADNATSKTDIVFSGIKFSTSGTAVSAVVLIGADSHASNTITHLYFDNCPIHVDALNDDVSNITITSQTELVSKYGLWNCDITSPLTVVALGSTGYFNKGLDWTFVVGGSFEGGSDAGENHHIYPGAKNKSLHLWIDFAGGTGRNHCINLNFNPQSEVDLEYADHHVIGYCHFSSAERSHDASNGQPVPNDPSHSRFRNLLCAGCKFDNLSGIGTVSFYCADDYTLRDFEAWGSGSARFLKPEPSAVQGAVLKLQVYRGKIHVASGVAGTEIFELGSANFTQLFEITDNITVDERATSRAISVAFTEQTGATIDRNQWYFPNDAGANGFRDLTTEKTLTQWQTQGYDVNGSVADPGWTDAANGDFS